MSCARVGVRFTLLLAALVPCLVAATDRTLPDQPCVATTEQTETVRKIGADCQTALEYMSVGNPFQALALLQAAVETLDRLTPPDYHLHAQSLFLLGEAHRQTGQPAKAAVLFDRALEIYESRYPKSQFEIALILNSAGANAYDRKHSETAGPLLERAYKLMSECCASQHVHLAKILNNQAAVDASFLKFDEAEQKYLQAVSLYERTPGSSELNLATALGNIAGLRFRRGDARGAESMYLRAKEVWGRCPRGANPLHASFCGNYGAFLVREHRYQEAEHLVRQSVDMLDACCSEHPAMVTRLRLLAFVLKKVHKDDEAKQVLRRAQELLDRNPRLRGEDQTVSVDALQRGQQEGRAIDPPRLRALG